MILEKGPDHLGGGKILALRKNKRKPKSYDGPPKTQGNPKNEINMQGGGLQPPKKNKIGHLKGPEIKKCPWRECKGAKNRS